jgi:hypothetical protein
VNTEEDAYLKRLVDLEKYYNSHNDIKLSFSAWLITQCLSTQFYEFAMELKYDSR